LRDTHQIIQQLIALLRHGCACLSLELPEVLLDAKKIGPPLSINVPDDLGEPERQLLLLPLLAPIDHRLHPAQQRIRIDRRVEPERD
jgi:hypothetical protein